jgi:hypothetical protein
MTAYPYPTQVGVLVQRIAAATHSPRFEILQAVLNTTINAWENLEPETPSVILQLVPRDAIDPANPP